MDNEFQGILDVKGLKSVSKGALIAFFGTVLSNLAAYVFLVLKARILGPFWLGIYALCVAVVTSAVMLSQIGFPTSLIRYVAIYRSIQDHPRLKGTLRFTFGLSFLASAILSVVLWLAARPLAFSFFHNPSLIRPLQLFSVSVPFVAVFFLLIAVFQGLKNMEDMVFIQYLQPLIGICIFLLLIPLFSAKIWAAVAAYAVSHLVSSIAGYWRLTQRLPFLLDSFIKPLVNRKEIILYALPLLFMGMIIVLFQRVDTIMIGYFLSAENVGLYQPASNLALGVSAVLLIFNRIFSPTIADYYHHNKLKELSYLFKTVTRWVFTISFPLFLLILLLNKELMLCFGSKYVAARLVVMVLSFGQLINASVGSVGLMLTMTGHQRFMLLATVVANTLNITLNFFWIPRFGINGAALATGISISLWNILALLFVVRVIRIHPFSVKFYKPFLSGMLAFIITFFITRSFSLFYVFQIILVGVIFSALFFLFHSLFKFEKEELFVLKAILSKAKG